jgi:hypothetical protein
MFTNPFLPPPDRPVSAPPAPRDPLTAYRQRRFLQAGFTESQASAMAPRRDIDMHSVRNLVDAGCPHDTAFDIVA